MVKPKRAASKGAALLSPPIQSKGPKMAKWKAPADAGPGVSVGGQFFPIVDGFVVTPDEGDYSQALAPFGFVPVEQGKDEVATPVALEAAPAPAAPEPEPAPEPAAEPEAEATDDAPKAKG